LQKPFETSSYSFVARVILNLLFWTAIRKQDLSQSADLIRLFHRHAHLDAHKAAILELRSFYALPLSVSRATCV
jgi:hypothetical protein